MMKQRSGRVERVTDEIIDLLSIVVVVVLTVGLVLAMVGQLVPWLFLLVTVPGVAGGWWWWRATQRGDRSSEETSKRAPAPSASRTNTVLLVFVLVVIASVTFLNLKTTGEHLLTDRDPGVYVTTGKWLADHGTLLVDGAVGGFSGVEHVTGMTAGYYDRVDDRLDPQFSHGFATALALANWVGGDRLMLNLNPLIGAAFLVLLHVLLLRLFSVWVAVVAFLTAAWNLVFWFFVRDAYSEPLVALLLVMALLAAHRGSQEGSQRHWVLAGALVGVTTLVRMDAWFYVTAFAAVIGVAVLHAARSGGALSRRFGFLTLLAMWAFGVIGYLDLWWRSPQYLSHHLASVTPMLAAAVASGVFALVCVLVADPDRRLFQKAASVWGVVGRYVRRVGAAGLGLFLLWAVCLRPLYSQTTGTQANLVTYLMTLEGIPADGTRSFYELAGRWLTWYWGIPGVIIASVGSMLALGRASFVRRDRFWIALTLCGIAMLPYLVKPSITPDQMWALRRFYPMALVGIAVAIGAVFTLLATWEVRAKVWKMGVVTVGALLVTVLPLIYALPMATARTQVGIYGTTQDLCAELPEDAVVLMEAEYLRVVFPAAVRSFCHVPVASLTRDATQETITTVAERWASLGKTLYLVVMPDTDPIPQTELITEAWFERKDPERTLTRRPSGRVTEFFYWKLLKWVG